MVLKILFWLYLINAILLIDHEIDSAFWKEWELFKLPGGIGGFLILHFPILFLILYGLVLVYKQSFERFKSYHEVHEEKKDCISYLTFVHLRVLRGVKTERIINEKMK